MNDDQPLGLIAQKRAEHRRLDEEIVALAANPEADQLEIARLKNRLEDENVALRRDLDDQFMLDDIIGASPALRVDN